MSDEYLGPIKFIVAIVGPQEQELSDLHNFIRTNAL